MWKKCSGKDNEHVSEWSTRARKNSEQQNQHKTKGYVEPHKDWFKPNVGKFSGKAISREQEKTICI